MLVRRINFLGGPGVGKSVTASYIFSRLKTEGEEVELIQEFAKEWAYEKKTITEYDQLALYSTQLAREYRVLKSSNTVSVICESPTLLTIPYAIKYNFPCIDSLSKIEEQFESEYPSLNIFLDRKDCPYKEEGRYENLKMAKKMDNMIENYLTTKNIIYFSVPYNEQEEIYALIKDYF